jgi:hypothetical protein
MLRIRNVSVLKMKCKSVRTLFTVLVPVRRTKITTKTSHIYPIQIQLIPSAPLLLMRQRIYHSLPTVLGTI